jgi:hypothetical protein
MPPSDAPIYPQAAMLEKGWTDIRDTTEVHRRRKIDRVSCLRRREARPRTLNDGPAVQQLSGRDKIFCC